MTTITSGLGVAGIFGDAAGTHAGLVCSMRAVSTDNVVPVSLVFLSIVLM